MQSNHDNIVYLCKTTQAEIFPHIVVGEITKTSHPYIGSNEHPNCIVELSCFKVMVH